MKNNAREQAFLGRAWFGDVLAEFAAPKKPTGRVVILCDGCPAMPAKKKVIERLARSGYWVFHLRYRGSFESKGKFLKYSPSDDVLLVARGIREGFVNIYDGLKYVIEVRDCVAIGASFGGAAVLLAAESPLIHKVVALAPLVDWTVESKREPFSSFVHVVQKGFGDAYRPIKDAYQKLISGTFFQPVLMDIPYSKNKVCILQAKDDVVVSLPATRAFAKKMHAKLAVQPLGGHYGLSNILDKELWRIIIQFIRSV